MDVDDFGCLGWIIIAVIVIALIITIDSVWTKNYCRNYDRLQSEMEFDWTFWTGCLVKADNGKWIKAREYMQYYGELYTLQLGEVGE